MRICTLVAATLLASAPAFSQTDDHASHLAEVDGLRVVHVWTPAVRARADALLYLEIENTSAQETVLTGGEAMGDTLDLVGFSYGASGETWAVLPGLPIPAGSTLALEPKVLALRWTSVPSDLVEGGDLEITVSLGGRMVTADVEIGPSDARAHSHAGHNH